MNRGFPYSYQYNPPAPVLHIRFATPGENPQLSPLIALIDTGSDGTLVPRRHLEAVEAIAIGEAMLHGLWGGSRKVDLYEIDIHIGKFTLPGVIVACNEMGDEILLGRNVLNRLILLLNGLESEIELLIQGSKAVRKYRS